MYRVYDLDSHTWLNEVFMMPNGMLMKIKSKKVFGIEKLSILPKNKYVIHLFTGLHDKKGDRIYEGDLCKIPDNDSVMTVAYSPQTGSHCLFDEKNSVYYQLNSSNASLTKIVGNVFDGIVFSDDEEDEQNDFNEG